MKGVCKVCGKEFSYYPSTVSGVFCSRKCYFIYARGRNHPRYKDKIEITCEQCGKEVFVKPSIAKTKRFCSKICRSRWDSEYRRGINNPHWKGGDLERVCQRCGVGFEVPQRVADRGGGLYCSNTCRLQAIGLSKPTGMESKLIGLIQKHGLPFKYVGDAEIAIGKGKRHSKYPDFINEEQKWVIELFGTYWHSPLLNPKTPMSRTYDETIRHYAKNGYSCLIIWDKELKDENRVYDKIQSFMEDNFKC